MPAFIVAIGTLLGISPLRVIAYFIVIVLVVGGALTIRQHYIDVGWHKHAAKIEKQDNAAIAVDKRVESDLKKCTDSNGFWDVITQDCMTQDAATAQEGK